VTVEDVTEGEKESSGRTAGSAVLPKIIHIGIPIATALIILAFALTLALPADRSPFSGASLARADGYTSTVFFIPIYIAIVIVMVFGSMYIFKRFVDSDPDSSIATAPEH
jgi:hypothetical protein